MQYEIEDADVGFEGYVTKIRFPKKKEDYNGWCAFDFQVDSVFIGEIRKNTIKNGNYTFMWIRAACQRKYKISCICKVRNEPKIWTHISSMLYEFDCIFEDRRRRKEFSSYYFTTKDS